MRAGPGTSRDEREHTLELLVLQVYTWCLQLMLWLVVVRLTRNWCCRCQVTNVGTSEAG
jgi:endonuclease/exonuclease/phosphatase (EEP) superfamily protein YafD